MTTAPFVTRVSQSVLSLFGLKGPQAAASRDRAGLPLANSSLAGVFMKDAPLFHPIDIRLHSVTATRWEVVGSRLDIEDQSGDPQIFFSVESRAGLCSALLEIETDSAKISDPVLYVDRGDGFSEATRTSVAYKAGDRHAFLIDNFENVSQFRYDPSDRPCEISITSIKVLALEKTGVPIFDGVDIESFIDMAVDPATGAVAFSSDDPNMRIRPGSLPAGEATVLELDISVVGGHVPRPRLYLGLSETESCDFIYDGRGFHAVLINPSKLKVIRVDPDDRMGGGRITRMAFRPLEQESLFAQLANWSEEDPADPVKGSLSFNKAIRARIEASKIVRGVLHEFRNGRVRGFVFSGAAAPPPIVELVIADRLVAAMEAIPLLPGQAGFQNDVVVSSFELSYSALNAPAGMSIIARIRGGMNLAGSPFLSTFPDAGPLSLIDKRRDESLRDAETRLAERRPASTLAGPLVSILIPVYNVAEIWLRRLADSVLRQTYQNWEICFVDDASPHANVHAVLLSLAKLDSRIKVKFRTSNGGISAATNDALAMANGPYVALVDNDDMITCDALEAMVIAIHDNNEPDWLYSDEFRIDNMDRASQLFAKPDWSPMFMNNYMYTGHLTLYKTALVRDVGSFRSEYDFSQDYDLALRIADTNPSVVHVGKYLYAWRMIEGSAAQGGKPTARISNIAALQDAADRRKWGGKAVPLPTANRVVRETGDDAPLVSIVVPSDNVDNIVTTIASINDRTDYKRYEIIIVTNSKIVDQLKDENQGIVWERFDRPYSFSAKCNAGGEVANGRFVIFFNDDVRTISSNWIECLLECLTIPGVGVVGPKLIYENGLIQHAGMVTGVRRLVGTAFHAYPQDTSTHFNMAQCVREVSLICGALLAMPLDLFRRVGGFDAANVPINHSDVDLCFKVREAGFSCVYTPHTTLLHIGHASLAEVDKENAVKKKTHRDKADVYIIKRWGHYLSRDPYFPPAMRDLVYLDSQEHFHLYSNAFVEKMVVGSGQDTLIVSHDLTDSGAPKVVFDMALALKEQGDFVTVISPFDGPYRQRLADAGIPVVIDPLVLDAGEDSMIIAKSFDRVIANTIVCWRTVRSLSEYMPVYWYVHETGSIEHYVVKNPDIVSVLAMPAGLWTGSERSAEALRRFNCIPTILEYGVDNKVAPRVDAGPLRIALFGSYEERKGQDIAVLGIKNVPEIVRSQVRFTAYGRMLDDKFRSKVEVLAHDVAEVELMSELTYERYREKLSRADIVIVASRDDTLPLVSLDALALGKPLVCSEGTGTSAYLENGVSAMIFENESSADLATKLHDLILDANLRKFIGDNGKKVFEQTFTPSQFKRRLLDHMQ